MKWSFGLGGHVQPNAALPKAQASICIAQLNLGIRLWELSNKLMGIPNELDIKVGKKTR